MRILRATVQVGDVQSVRGEGPVVKVAMVSPDEVEFWWLSNEPDESFQREFTVTGTGHLFDEVEWAYRGTTERHQATGLVWHLLERVW